MVLFKRFLKLSALALVMILIYMPLSFVFTRTTSGGEMHIRYFYKEPKNSLDTILIGASDLYTAYCAPLAYKNAGYTSYSLSYENAAGAMYKSMLTEALKRQNPKLVVFEVNGFFYTEKETRTEPSVRKWADNIPLSKNRIDVINENVKPEDRLPYYFNFVKYHSNWSTSKENSAKLERFKMMSKNEVSLTKSFSTQTRKDIKKTKKKPKIKKLTSFGKQSLEKLLEYCKEKSLKNVLFMRTPHYFSCDKQSENELNRIITAAGYDFINFDNYFKKIGINKKHDFYNYEHLNVFGSEKFTDYFSTLVKGKYNLNENHSDKTVEQWNKCVDYTTDAFEKLKKRTEVNESRYYYEFSDFSEEARQKWLLEQAEKKAAKRKKSANSQKAKNDVPPKIEMDIINAK